jgi:hypothetical protein
VSRPSEIDSRINDSLERRMKKSEKNSCTALKVFASLVAQEECRSFGIKSGYNNQSANVRIYVYAHARARGAWNSIKSTSFVFFQMNLKKTCFKEKNILVNMHFL